MTKHEFIAAAALTHRQSDSCARRFLVRNYPDGTEGVPVYLEGNYYISTDASELQGPYRLVNIGIVDTGQSRFWNMTKGIAAILRKAQQYSEDPADGCINSVTMANMLDTALYVHRLEQACKEKA